ncbi:Ig-like domain-containing protein [Paenibacillus sp. J5C_2022]|uniref:Ig-like domain-containing protein n=1 Tax=Paenibacillus sp. J5C2022 TaxID=2977129 RepID=UPI0021D19B0A|nr:Ig-like domain-containing protein [Paenibacillus sp. J5C2022]MCU6708456.1 Ig-like domain-containing protein [Paenibacillus sp. J5C2022]
MYRIRKLSIFIALIMVLQLGLYGWSEPTGVSAATGGPVASGYSPADNLTSVPLNSDLKITFDEKVKKGPYTANIAIYKSGTNKLVESISVTSSQVWINSSDQREVTINPYLNGTSGKFELNTDYYVLIDAGAFLNVSNSAAYAGIQNATTWNFRTVAQEDNQRPSHVTRLPEGSNVPITTTLSLSFDEAVYVAEGSIRISSTDDTRYIPVTSSGVTGSGSSQIIVRPDSALLPNTTYTITIASDNFQDASGNGYPGSSWSFTTAPAPVNMASSSPLNPADDAALVPIDTNLTIQFDQNVQANNGKYIEIRKVSDNGLFERLQATSSRITVNGSSATIDPSYPFAANTAYYVLIEPGAFSKPDPNASEWFYGIPAATVWNFSTGYGNDNSAPYVTKYKPGSGSSANSAQSKLELTFNEPVYPHTGNIEIRQSIGGALFRSIPMTSERVKGGGTKELVIDATSAIGGEAAKSFINNTRYYVTIGNRAIRDGAGNFYSGISSTSGWTFTVSKDTDRPQLDALSPANNATAVAVRARFAATFNTPVIPGTEKIYFHPITSSASVPSVEANFWVDSGNTKRMFIQPSQDLQQDKDYYIYIEENAITDLVGNSFIGIQNQYQWTFKTIGGDKTAPTVAKSEVSGSVIRLIYNEPLNTKLKPTPASYYVTVAGAPRNVTSVKIEGNMVLLTLASSVSNNQKVILSYSKPSTGLVQDISGNEAASISNMDVSNGYTSTNPVVSSGSVSGNTVRLNFSESLMAVSEYAHTQFSVNVGGSNYSILSMWHSGSVIQLTLSNNIPSDKSVHVTYSPSSYPLTGTSGNRVNGFSNYNVREGNNGNNNGGDYYAPYVQFITASGNAILIKYNEPLNSTTAPGSYQYSVTVDGQLRSVLSASVSGDTVVLTVNEAIDSGAVTKVSYIGSSYALKDYNGNPAASFANIVANSGTGTGQTGTLQGAILKGNILTLTFNQVLNQSSIPTTSQFVVNVKSTIRLVSNVQVTGNTVILTLASAANAGDAAQVSYISSNTGLKTIGGGLVNGFTNMNVANQTSLLDSLTGDFEAADGGGVGIKTSAATSTTDLSPSGQSTKRYAIKNDKFVMAVAKAREAGITVPRIVFKVPDYEKAAMAGVSIAALDMASKQGDVIFVVQHGDMTYELPLSAVDLYELSKMAAGNNVNTQLVISIDKGTTTAATSLKTAISSSKASIVNGPVHYEVMIVNGTSKQQVTEFEGYLAHTLQTSYSVDASQLAAVWLDPVTSTLSYVPTSVKKENGRTIASFKRQGSGAYALVRHDKSFTDLSKHWAAREVEMMASKFIVEGHSVTKYAPDKSITRGEFATYIAKGLGLGGNREAAAKFKDVNKDTAMGAYIGAAAAAGIVNGTSGDTFKPNSYIKRQDMAVMMMRAAKVAGLQEQLPQSADSYLNVYRDKGELSDYAKEDVAHAIHLGIINGKSETRLSPTTNASRAEGAVMIMRLLEKAGFLTQ